MSVSLTSGTCGGTAVEISCAVAADGAADGAAAGAAVTTDDVRARVRGSTGDGRSPGVLPEARARLRCGFRVRLPSISPLRPSVCPVGA